MKFEKMTDRQLESWVRTASRLLESAALEADIRGIDIYENQTINEAPPLMKPTPGIDDKKAERTKGPYPKQKRTTPMNEAPPLRKPGSKEPAKKAKVSPNYGKHMPNIDDIARSKRAKMSPK